MITKDDSNTYLEALTPGFSSFAIGYGIEEAKQLETIPWQAPASTVTETPEATAESQSEKASPVNLAAIIGMVGLTSAVAYVDVKRKEIFR